MSNLCTHGASQQNPPQLSPIGEVARQTGINPVALRVWERRYALIQPQRSAKDSRLYTRDRLTAFEKCSTGQAVRTHQAELLELPQLTCSTDPLQAFHSL